MNEPVKSDGSTDVKYLLEYFDWPESSAGQLFYWNGFESVLYTVPRQILAEIKEHNRGVNQ